MSGTLISVVLPVFNEYENIGPCLRGLARALEGHEHEILVCYDFDEDTTLRGIAEMTDAPASMRLVKNTLGRGAPNAIRAGFQAARGDVVVTTMADLSDPPEVIVKMAEKIRAGADVVAGSRYVSGGSQEGGPLLKRFLSECAGRSLAWIAGVGTQDATSNFRGYSKSFLDRVTVESRAGFEIALELTVKAHLSGGRVDEVPSTWVDRTAGTSRFRLWKWLPNYLRWYLRATWVPLVVWSVWAVLAAAFPRHMRGASGEFLLDGAAVLCFALAAGAALLLARRVRGRTTLVDALQPALWLHPWHADLVHTGHAALDIALTAAASVVALCASTIGDRAREWRAKTTASLRALVSVENIGWVVVTLALWAAHLSLPRRVSGPELDTSWAQGLGYALRHGFQFGSEILFTYGPLGYFNAAPYDAELFWTKILLYELVFKLLLAAFVVRAIRRLDWMVERVLCCAALCFLNPDPDPYFFLGIFAVTSAIVERDRRRPWLDVAGVLVIELMALVKFTYFAFAGFALVVAILDRARRRSAGEALGLALLSALSFLALWTACGQSLAHAPEYVRRSLAIAGAYNEAMSAQGPWRETQLACIAAALCLLVLAWNSWLEPRNLARHLLACVCVCGLYFAFKAGFVRHMRNAVNLFAYAGPALYLLAPVSPRHLLRGALAAQVPRLLRFSCLCVCAVGYVETLNYAERPVERALREAIAAPRRELAGLADLDELRATRERERAELAAFYALRKVKERVGDASIDAFGASQGMLFLNDLSWRPRPVFQSYVAYTSELLEANARYFEGPRAPAFVLYRPEGIDLRYPGQEDCRALEVMLRCYEPVASEGGFLLYARKPNPPPAPLARPVLLEQDIAFGEHVDLTRLDAGAELLCVDIEYSDWGRIWKLIAKSPAITLVTELSNGVTDDYRIIPGMMRTGVLIDPYVESQDRWIKWLLGELGLRVQGFRVRIPDGQESLFDPRIRIRVLDASDLVQDPSVARRAGLEYAMFTTKPKRVTSPVPVFRTMFMASEVLVVYTPSEMVFDVGAGEQRLTGSFGIHPDAFPAGPKDGLRFEVVLREQNGAERVLFERPLTPLRERKERRRQTLDVTFHASGPAELLLRTDPGPQGDPVNDTAYWSGIQIAPLAQ